MRAFHIIVDYDDNKIGFANKVRHFGAEIVGDQAPGNPRPWYTFGKEDAPQIVIPVMPVEPVEPVTPQNTTTQNTTAQNTTEPTTNTTVTPTNPDTGIIPDDKPPEHVNTPIYPIPSKPTQPKSTSTDILIGTIAVIVLVGVVLMVLYC